MRLGRDVIISKTEERKTYDSAKLYFEACDVSVDVLVQTTTTATITLSSCDNLVITPSRSARKLCIKIQSGIKLIWTMLM